MSTVGPSTGASGYFSELPQSAVPADVIKDVRQAIKSIRAMFFRGLFNVLAPGQTYGVATKTVAEMTGLNPKSLTACRFGTNNFSAQKVALLNEVLAKKRQEAFDSGETLLVNAIDQLDTSVMMLIPKEVVDRFLGISSEIVPMPPAPAKMEVLPPNPLRTATLPNIAMIVEGVGLSVPRDRSVTISIADDALQLVIKPQKNE